MILEIHIIFGNRNDKIRPQNNINNPVIIKKLNEENNFVATYYLPLKNGLVYAFFHGNKIRFLTTIPYSNGSLGLTVFNLETEMLEDEVLYYERMDLPTDNFYFDYCGQNINIVYEGFLNEGRGMDIFYNVLEDADGDGFFTQTDCNDEIASIHPRQKRFPIIISTNLRWGRPCYGCGRF